MSTPAFPEPKVTELIEKLALKFGLKILSVKFTSRNDLDLPDQESRDEKWQWSLGKPNSTVTIGIGFYFPSLISNVIFINSSPGKKYGHFLLDKCLRDYLKNNEDYSRIQKVIMEHSWEQDWSIHLDILEEHLAKDLGKVITGEEWPDIPFNWEDYVEPAAVDKIYEDQRRILDEETPGKPRNAWIYFMDYFRRK